MHSPLYGSTICEQQSSPSPSTDGWPSAVQATQSPVHRLKYPEQQSLPSPAVEGWLSAVQPPAPVVLPPLAEPEVPPPVVPELPPLDPDQPPLLVKAPPVPDPLLEPEDAAADEVELAPPELPELGPEPAPEPEKDEPPDPPDPEADPEEFAGGLHAPDASVPLWEQQSETFPVSMTAPSATQQVDAAAVVIEQVAAGSQQPDPAEQVSPLSAHARPPVTAPLSFEVTRAGRQAPRANEPTQSHAIRRNQTMTPPWTSVGQATLQGCGHETRP